MDSEFSIFIFLFQLAALAIHGLKWGLDFTGGTQIEVSYPQAADLQLIREDSVKLGFNEAQVVSYGTSKDVLISIAPRADMEQSDLVDKSHEQHYLVQSSKELILSGPQVGQELATKGRWHYCGFISDDDLYRHAF